MFKRNLNIYLVVAFLAVISLIPDEESLVVASTRPMKKNLNVATTKRFVVKKKSTKDITTLEEALKAGVPVVVKLGSDWCYPCRMMKPIIKELAVEQDGKAIFLDLDVYKHKEMAKAFEVRVIPTIIFYNKHGEPRAKKEGFMSKEQLLKAIEDLELNK